LGTHSIRNKRDRGGQGERRGGSRWVSLLTDWVSDSEPVPFFCANKCESLLSDIHRPSKPKAREGRQVNEDKSIVRGSEEIPNVNEESIRFLSGL